MRDRSRAAGKRAHAIAVKLSSRAAQAAEEKQAAVARATGELADLAERAAAEARRLLPEGDPAALLGVDLLSLIGSSPIGRMVSFSGGEITREQIEQVLAAANDAAG